MCTIGCYFPHRGHDLNPLGPSFPALPQLKRATWAVDKDTLYTALPVNNIAVIILAYVCPVETGQSGHRTAAAGRTSAGLASVDSRRIRATNKGMSGVHGRVNAADLDRNERGSPQIEVHVSLRDNYDLRRSVAPVRTQGDLEPSESASIPSGRST